MAESGHVLQLEVLTPEGEVFSGPVKQLSTRTSVGEIGILANHVPVLARLRPTEMRLHLSDSEVRRYAQSEGWLQVFANSAKVLVGECHEPGALDVAALQERLRDAEQRVAETEEKTAAREQAERDRERSQVFLRIAGHQ